MDASLLLRATGASVLVVLVAACATTTPAGPDGDRRFYEARCGACHVPYPREHFDADEWPGILEEMAPRAGLSKSQRARVLGYLTASLAEDDDRSR
jgi:hypothetical protein